MLTNIVKPELLAPAGNFGKLQAALIYGADDRFKSGGTAVAANPLTIFILSTRLNVKKFFTENSND